MKDSIREWAYKVSEDLLLDGFRNRPGVQPWIGEHAGKYSDSVMLINEQIGDKYIADKVDKIMQGLLSCQEDDGYLGTYAPKTRWKQDVYIAVGAGGGPGEAHLEDGWDLWVAKYNILAMLKYHEVKKDQKVLSAACRIADQIVSLFGEGGSLNLNLTDQHAGLASGSFLEALMQLYGVTRDKKYLDFGRRIVEWYWGEESKGTPHLIKNMDNPSQLRHVGVGKGYEMMSCFVGLLEYARYSGETKYIDKVRVARDNIACYYRSLTGCMTEHEWFKDPGTAGERDDLENCVAFTWIQLNTRLFELSGDPACIEYAEESALNHILSALCPDGSTWIYYLTQTGPKDFSYWSQLPDTAVNTGAPMTCCQTNGQRALGLVPRYIYTVSKGKALINLFFDSSISIDLDGNKVNLVQKTDFPRSGRISLSAACDKACEIAVRMPQWAKSVTVNGAKKAAAEAYFPLKLAPGKNEFIIEFEYGLRLLTPGHTGRGKYAIAWGPLVYAVDTCPQGWKNDEIALLLDGRTIFGSLKPKEENGWLVFEAPAARADASTGTLQWHDIPASLEKSTVILRPFMFAGLDKNLACGQCYDRMDIVYDRSPVLTGYRVLFPCFFV
jgi:DUF1680 family protein